jgi:hypothetical protein
LKAGLDIGAALTKAAWGDQKQTNFLSTADMPLAKLFGRLEQAGVRRLVVTGRGLARNEIPKLFEVVECDGHLKALTRGITAVLPSVGLDPGAFILADIGFSTRYAIHLKHTDRTTEMPYNQGLGGGYLQGQVNLLALNGLAQMSELALDGAAPDVLAKDLDAASGGTVGGENSLVHFGWAESGTPMEDVCAGHIQMVACAVARDMMFHRLVLRSLSQNDDSLLPLIFVVGTPANRLAALRESLKIQLTRHLFVPFHPPYGEYLAAYGAWLMPET